MVINTVSENWQKYEIIQKSQAKLSLTTHLLNFQDGGKVMGAVLSIE